jgi:Na+/proline symporter
MYLVGRILASGARLYLAAIAVSMIIFLDVQPQQIIIASAVLVVFGVAFTLFGGLNAVIWSDLVQVVLYLGGAVLVLVFLLVKIPAPMPEIWDALQSAPGGVDKLRLFDWSLDFTKPFTIWAILTGLVLLNIGNAGLDQDTTQRFLACENAQSGKRALYASMWAAIPVVALFMAIGSLLHIFYNRPDLMLTVDGDIAIIDQYSPYVGGRLTLSYKGFGVMGGLYQNPFDGETRGLYGITYKKQIIFR